MEVIQLSPELPNFRECLGTALKLTYKDLHASLRSLLAITEDSLCSDPRDRIYALLSLTDQRTRKHIVPDYNKSAGDLYKEVTQYIIGERRSLNILIQCSLFKNQPGLETWVPDWSVRKSSLSIDFGQAAGASAAEVTFHGTSLNVVGVKFSTLKFCGQIIGNCLSGTVPYAVVLSEQDRSYLLRHEIAAYLARLSKWGPPNLRGGYILLANP